MLMPRALLIVLSLSVCGVRIHSRHVDVSGVLREMNSCLRVVRHALRRSASLTHTVCSITPLSTGL
jgi:hypothetical protein